MPVELVFIHGWGFDARFWDALSPHLSRFPQRRIDLGFFDEGSPPLAGTVEDAPLSGKKAILIGHSFGFFWGIRQRADWSGWVAINGFPRFVQTPASPGCVTPATLREMRMRLKADPRGCLQGFYKRVGAARAVGAFNTGRLHEGLDELRSSDIEERLAVLDVPGLVLAGGKDPLVPPELSETLGACASEGSCAVRDESGHLLPQTDAVWCARAIANFVTANFDSSMTLEKQIAERFGRAAETYDQAASVQERVAENLVQKASRKTVSTPATVLDVGCGTGFVAAAIAREWPSTAITAIDNSPAMLAEASRKLPRLRGIENDMATGDFGPVFDLIVSSMALQWLRDPRAALELWRGWLKPQGRIFAALPVAGSFAEWKAWCENENQNIGLWPLPPADFAEGLATGAEIELIAAEYPSARDFLRGLRETGAATPRSGHRPVAVPPMRRILARAPKPFTVTYRILYLEIHAHGI